MSSKANYTLIFKASKIPALGFRTFFVQKMMSRREQSQALLQQAKPVKVALAQTDASTALPPLRLETDVSRLKVVELQLPVAEHYLSCFNIVACVALVRCTHRIFVANHQQRQEHHCKRFTSSHVLRCLRRCLFTFTSCCNTVLENSI